MNPCLLEAMAINMYLMLSGCKLHICRQFKVERTDEINQDQIG